MPWPNPVSTRHHADLNAPTNRAGTCPVSRLYGQVDWTVNPISLVDFLYWRLMNQGPKGVRSPMDKMPDG